MSTGGILGRTLAGRFRVTGFIGEGAMASVYRAVQEGEPHDVALKIMHPHLVSDPTFVGRFRREAKAASRIVHPNVVKIIDTGVDGSLLYIAMELLGGQDLFETLVLERRLAEARAARILVEVTDALVAAHERGVVHRDLKPENIMLLRDPEDPAREEVRVLDFGIAKLLEWDSPSMDTSMNSALTGVGTVVGTPAYMSPEQCRGEPVDTRSDVYTCGILLYQLVSGRLPFASENAMDLAVMHVRAPPTPLESVVPEVNRDLAAVIMTALSKWPSQRQQTAAELRDALRGLLPELSAAPLALAASAERGQTGGERRGAGGDSPEDLAAKEATTLPPGVAAVNVGEQTGADEAAGVAAPEHEAAVADGSAQADGSAAALAPSTELAPSPALARSTELASSAALTPPAPPSPSWSRVRSRAWCARERGEGRRWCGGRAQIRPLPACGPSGGGGRGRGGVGGWASTGGGVRVGGAGRGGWCRWRW